MARRILKKGSREVKSFSNSKKWIQLKDPNTAIKACNPAMRSELSRHFDDWVVFITKDESYFKDNEKVFAAKLTELLTKEQRDNMHKLMEDPTLEQIVLYLKGIGIKTKITKKDLLITNVELGG